MTTDQCLADNIALMSNSRAYNHPLLDRLNQMPMAKNEAIRFGVQWYKAATAHKKSFPGLIYNTTNDAIRLQLIRILDEEYGYGEESEIHARLLERFLIGLGIDPARVPGISTNEKVEAFSSGVDNVWLKSDPIKAYGAHFALEYLAAKMHKSFFSSLQDVGLSDTEIRYFQLHSTVEEEHSKIAEVGFTELAKDDASCHKLSEGVMEGVRLVALLLDGLEEAITDPNSCGRAAA